MLEALFVYGTLKDPATRQQLLGRTLEGSPDTLDGFRTVPTRLGEATYLTAIESAGDRIDGLVLHVSRDELSVLDDYETNAYRRTLVVLRSGRSVWIYRR